MRIIILSFFLLSTLAINSLAIMFTGEVNLDKKKYNSLLYLEASSCNSCLINLENEIYNELKNVFKDSLMFHLIIKSSNYYEQKFFKEKLKWDKIYFDSKEKLKNSFTFIDPNANNIMHIHNIADSISLLYDFISKYDTNKNTLKLFKKIQLAKGDSLINITTPLLINDKLYFINNYKNCLSVVDYHEGTILYESSPPDSLEFYYFDKAKDELFQWEYLKESYSPMVQLTNLICADSSFLIGASFFYKYKIENETATSWTKIRSLIEYNSKYICVYDIENPLNYPYQMKSDYYNDTLILDHYTHKLNKDKSPILSVFLKDLDIHKFTHLHYIYNTDLGLKNEIDILQNIEYLGKSKNYLRFFDKTDNVIISFNYFAGDYKIIKIPILIKDYKKFSSFANETSLNMAFIEDTEIDILSVDSSNKFESYHYLCDNKILSLQIVAKLKYEFITLALIENEGWYILRFLY